MAFSCVGPRRIGQPLPRRNCTDSTRTRLVACPNIRRELDHHRPVGPRVDARHRRESSSASNRTRPRRAGSPRAPSCAMSYSTSVAERRTRGSVGQTAAGCPSWLRTSSSAAAAPGTPPARCTCRAACRSTSCPRSLLADDLPHPLQRFDESLVVFTGFPVGHDAPRRILTRPSSPRSASAPNRRLHSACAAGAAHLVLRGGMTPHAAMVRSRSRRVAMGRRQRRCAPSLSSGHWFVGIAARRSWRR